MPCLWSRLARSTTSGRSSACDLRPRTPYVTGKALQVRHDGLIPARGMFCLKDFPREVYRGSASPEFVQAAGGRVTGDGQQPVQDVFAEPAGAFPARSLLPIGNHLEAVTGNDAPERVVLALVCDAHGRADDGYVCEFWMIDE